MKKTYLDKLIPARGDNDGVLRVRAEAHARNPLSVALVSDGVLAVTQGVPELDGTVTRARNDLTVVGGERDGEDVVVVTDEGTGGSTAGELPQTERLVPRRGEGVGAVGGDHLSPLVSFFSLLPPTSGMENNIHSQRRCASDPADCAWGNRRPARRG